MMRWGFTSIVVMWFVGSVVFPAVAAEGPLLRDEIDARVSVAWQREGITPAAATNDAQFLRRVYLDLLGTIPSHDEAVSFLDDLAADKRSRLIDRLLDDPRYAQHQADVWDMVFFGRNPPGYQTDKREGFQRWLRDQFASNTPYDVWAGRILRAEGNSVDDGAPMFWAQYKSQPEDASQAVSQLFLGVQLQCARCHDHPFEPWTQLDFYGMAAFLARLDIVQVGKEGQQIKFAVGEKNTGDVLFTGPVSEQMPGKKGEPVKPKFLHGEPLEEPPLPDDFKQVKFETNKLPPPPLFSRKNRLADWITQPENPYFSRAVVNRVWAQFLGRGLVHPVDNMSPANPPTHPELLDAITRAFVDHQFDMKWYIRELCNSRVYQLSSSGATGDAFPEWFQHGRSRPLSAEELADAWRVATHYAAVEQASGKQANDNRFRPLTGGYMLSFFGQPNNGVGDFQGGLAEHLYLNNGQLGALLGGAKGTLVDQLSGDDASWDERVERLFLSVLSRRPNEQEREKFVKVLSEDKDRLRDAIWALLTCSEFRFNH